MKPTFALLFAALCSLTFPAWAQRSPVTSRTAITSRQAPLPAGLTAAGVTLWLDPSVGTVSSGGAISYLHDRSGHGNAASAVSTSQPATDTINGVAAYQIGSGGNLTPNLNASLATARSIFLVYDRTGLSAPPIYAPILGSLDTYVDMAGGDVSPRLWYSGAAAAIVGRQTGGLADLRFNGDWIDSVVSGQTGPTLKPSGPTVMTILAGAGVHFNNLGAFWTLTSRVDISRRGDLIVRSDVPTQTEIVAIEDYLLAKYAIAPGLTKRVIVFTGDSITYGFGLTRGTTDYPTVALSLLHTPSAWKSADIFAYNVGVSGQTAATMVTGDRLTVDRKFTHWAPVNVAVVFAGTNDLCSFSVATTEANILAAYNAQVAGMPPGGLVFVGTMLARLDGVGTCARTASFIADRATVVAWERATFPHLVDFAANATMGTDAAPNNSTYYQGDFVHPTAAGAAILAQVAATAINAAVP